MAVTKEAGSVEEVAIAGSARRVLVCVHPAATLYDSSQKETFASTIEKAARLSGAGTAADGGPGQSRLGDY